MKMSQRTCRHSAAHGHHGLLTCKRGVIVLRFIKVPLGKNVAVIPTYPRLLPSIPVLLTGYCPSWHVPRGGQYFISKSFGVIATD